VLRTSESDPIRVDWVDVEGPGRLGLTLAPGKRTPTEWRRDLQVDLDRLRGDLGVDVLVTLVEAGELEWLGIADLPSRARTVGLELLHLPIADGQVPSAEAARAVVRRIAGELASGRSVVVHCRGGLGRSGTLAACCLVHLGEDPPVAMARVRTARPGAIEQARQERFVEDFSTSVR